MKPVIVFTTLFVCSTAYDDFIFAEDIIQEHVMDKIVYDPYEHPEAFLNLTLYVFDILSGEQFTGDADDISYLRSVALIAFNLELPSIFRMAKLEQMLLRRFDYLVEDTARELAASAVMVTKSFELLIMDQIGKENTKLLLRLMTNELFILGTSGMRRNMYDALVEEMRKRNAMEGIKRKLDEEIWKLL